MNREDRARRSADDRLGHVAQRAVPEPSWAMFARDNHVEPAVM